MRTDYTGITHGELTYLHDVEPHIGANRKAVRKAQFQCSCGTTCVARIGNWVSGNTASCGHLNVEAIQRSNAAVLELGEKRGRLTLTALTTRRTRGGTSVRVGAFVCDCGKAHTCDIRSWTTGATSSCGCLFRERLSDRNTTHGLSSEPWYTNWYHMVARTQPGREWERHPSYRGVRRSPDWDTPEGFAATMPPGHFPGAHLARYGDTGDYTPENCRWLTKADNSRECANIRWGNQ